MTTVPVLKLDDEFGIVVDLEETIQEDPVEAAIAELHTPLTVELKLTASQRNRLQRLAEDTSQDINSYISSVILADLSQRVGRAVIQAPSKLGETSISVGSVSGYKGGLVSRA